MRALFRQVGFLTAASLAGKAASFGASLLLIWYMPVDDLAAVTLVLSIVTLFCTPIMGGVNRLIVFRDKVLDGEQPEAGVLAMVAPLVIALIIITMTLISAPFMWILLACALAACLVLHETAVGSLQRDAKFEHISLLTTIRGLVLLAAIGAGVLLGTTITVIVGAVAYGASYVVPVVLTKSVASSPGSLVGRMVDMRSSLALAASVFRGHAVFFGYQALTALMVNAPVLLLYVLASTENVATFGAYIRVYAGLMIVVSALKMIQRTRVRDAANHRELVSVIVEQAKFSLLISAPLLGIVLVSYFFADTLVGITYAGYDYLMLILGLSALLSLLLSPFGEVFVKYKWYMGQVSSASLSLVVALIVGTALLSVDPVIAAGATFAVAFSMHNALMAAVAIKRLYSSRNLAPVDTTP